MNGIIMEYFNDNINEFDFNSVQLPEGLSDDELVGWIIHKSGIPFIPLDLEPAPYSEMYKEALAIEDMFVKHRTGYGSVGWSSICIHGEEWDKTDYWTSYSENQGKTHDQIVYKWTEIADRCPITTEYFKNHFIHHNYTRLRFMWLDAGGYIEPHCDGDKHFLGAVNTALNNPEGCVFKMKGKGNVPFKDSGNSVLLDVANNHSVWNNSDTPRIHIISHGRPKQDYNQIVLRSLRKLRYNA